jgi:UDPglucose 6-dehydrogenase
LHFSTDLVSCLVEAEVVIIAVGTPPDEDGSADLKYVLEVARSIGKYIKKYTLIVTKSTVPVGTAVRVREVVEEEIHKRGINIDFDIASNPEFLKEGDAINDFMKPDRIIIGIESERSQELLKRLYKPFTLNGHQVIFMNIASAEMTKYVANSMLATRISFMNDVANLCEIVGADVGMVRKGIGSDTRIGSKFLYPGIGYGGSCFPKDVKALIKTADQNGYQMKVLKAVEEVNAYQKQVLFKKIFKYFNGQLKGKIIAIWGLAFKPLTDDMREAPSLEMIRLLKEAGCNIVVFDPAAMREAKRHLSDTVHYGNDPYEVLNNADCLVLATEWNEFRFPDWIKVKNLLRRPVVFDGRNVFDAGELQAKGFDYICIGINTLN